MSEPSTALQQASAGIVVDNLVTQFADAWDCIRELVQNSLDAGTSRIEVWLEFIPGEGQQGTIAIHVDDYGEGMDEQIIDGQLTKLFASNKEGDLTKIGKFGIGFVSIFALKPAGVLLITGRGGEYWEVFFHPDRSFSKTRLDDPVEGTQITLFLAGDANRYAEAVQNVRRTLKKWCKHSETEILFEDRRSNTSEVINEAFELEGICATLFEDHPGTQYVLAFADNPTYEFFNRGLTLASTAVADNVLSASQKHHFERVAFKVKSRYLEHTLSRDTVLRDENYRNVMQQMVTSIGVLRSSLVTAIKELVAKPSWSDADLVLYGRMLGYLEHEYSEGLQHEPIFRGLHGNVFSAAQLFEAWEADGRLLLQDQPSALTLKLHEAGVPVIFGRHRPTSRTPFPWDALTTILVHHAALRGSSGFLGWVRDFFSAYRPRIRASLCSPLDVYVPVDIDKTMPTKFLPLLQGATLVLRAVMGAPTRPMVTFRPLDSHNEMFLVGDARVNELKLPPLLGSLQGTDLIAVNREHPHVLKLVELHRHDAQLASYFLAKCLLLEQDRNLSWDQSLMRAARELVR
ncbi:MAG: ATP-binding protein [bacterium]